MEVVDEYHQRMVIRGGGENAKRSRADGQRPARFIARQRQASLKCLALAAGQTTEVLSQWQQEICGCSECENRLGFLSPQPDDTDARARCRDGIKVGKQCSLAHSSLANDHCGAARRVEAVQQSGECLLLGHTAHQSRRRVLGRVPSQ
jgi:hypothetical protein